MKPRWRKLVVIYNMFYIKKAVAKHATNTNYKCIVSITERVAFFKVWNSLLV